MNNTTQSILAIFLIPTLFCCAPNKPENYPKKKLILYAKQNNTALSSSGLAPATPSLKKLEEQMHAQINAYRLSIGKKPFTYHKGLSNYARQHSRFMADNPGRFAFFLNNISHQYFDYRSAVAEQKYNLNITENVIAGEFPDSTAAHNLTKAWLNSPSHKKNIDINWQTAGMGAARGKDGKLYFTQLFGSPKHVQNIHAAGYLGPKNW